MQLVRTYWYEKCNPKFCIEMFLKKDTVYLLAGNFCHNGFQFPSGCPFKERLQIFSFLSLAFILFSYLCYVVIYSRDVIVNAKAQRPERKKRKKE